MSTSMARMLHMLLLGVGAASIMAWSPDVLAYRQTKTCLTSEQRDPEAPTNLPTCALGQVGWPVRWNAREIPYKVYRRGSDKILPAVDGEINPEVLTVIRRAMRQWNEPDCTDFEFKYDGLTDVGRHAPEDGVNVISWVDDGWAESSATIALTTTTMTPKGVLVDADMEFNTRAHRFTITTPVGSGAMDLANTATHEAGHMLGLDEVPNKDSTMYYSAPVEEDKKRDLAPDDISGVCAIYPAGVPPVRYGDSFDPNDMGGDDGGPGGGCCATVSAPADGKGSPRGLLVLAALCGVGVWRKRRGE